MAKRGRPTNIGYPQVVEAAEKLLAEGQRPTIRRVREILDGGATSTIQRHLAEWRSTLETRQAITPLAVDIGGLASLGPQAFALLIARLLRTELREAGILAFPDTTLNIDWADGGIDGAISWEGGPDKTLHLPSRNVVWQAKSGQLPSPSELKRELQRGRETPTLKPALEAHFARGGSYVLFSAADVPTLHRAGRLQAMEDAIRGSLPNIAPTIRIVGASEIAAWASENLWARTFLIKSSGRDYPATMLTFEEWQQVPRFSNPFVASAQSNELIEKVRKFIEAPAGLFRLDGAPGLGKTRLMLEALRPIAAETTGIVYFDARHPEMEAELLRSISNWSRFGVTGILVVDNCTLALHQQLSQMSANSLLTTLTIGDRQQSADVTLYPMDSTTVGDIVNAHSLHPANSIESLRIVEYAQGWPQVAIDVLQSLRDGKEHIAELSDDELTRRLIGDPDLDSLRVLSLLALFDRVGYRGESIKDEWELLRTLFFHDGISRDRFYSIVQRFERAGIVTAIGRYWRVTPAALAIRLARTWLEEAPPEQKELLFSQLPPTLSNSLAQRISEITTPSSVELARSLLAYGARFGTLAGILGATNATLFGALAEVDPNSASAAIRRTIGQLSDAESSAIDDRDGRQTLVFALERLAFYRACFQDASQALYILSRTENARNSNNATGTLVKLFRVLGSQTEATPQDRLALIDRFLSDNDAIANARVAKILTAALAGDAGGWVTVGPESQGGRPPLSEWRPKLWSEVFDYCRDCIGRVLELARRGTEGRQLAREVTESAVPALTRYGLWNELTSLIGELKGGAWPKAVERLTWTLRHQLKDADDEIKSRVSALLADLTPTALVDQVELVITSPPYDLEDRGGVIVDNSLSRVKDFALDSQSRGNVDDVITILSTGYHRLSDAYTQFVAENTTDLADLADRALSIYSNASTPRSDAPLIGIFAVVADRDQRLREALLERIAHDESLLEALPALVAIPRATNAGTLLLTQVYESNPHAPRPRANIFIARLFANVSPTLVRGLKLSLLNNGWFGSAAELILFGTEKTAPLDDLTARLIIESKFISTELPDMHEWSMLRATSAILHSGNAQFAVAIAKQMIDLALSDATYSQTHRVSKLWADLLSYPEVLRLFEDTYRIAEPRQRWKLVIATQYNPEHQIGHRLALEHVQLNELVAFAGRYPDDLPLFLAQYGQMVDLKEQQINFTPLLISLLKAFGDREDVLRGLSANLHSFMTVGPRAGYYAERAALIDSIPPFSRRVAAWKEQLRASFDAERDRAALEDAEFQKGIF
jgi:Plasmid replication region DNA-binding N-term